MDSETTGELTDADRHQLNHRELYLSRQLDTLPATHIRYRLFLKYFDSFCSSAKGMFIYRPRISLHC